MAFSRMMVMDAKATQEPFSSRWSPQDAPTGAAPQPAAPTPAQAFAAIKPLIAELREYITHYISAKTDAVKLSVTNIVIYAVLGVVGALIGVTALVTATVLLLNGLSGAIGALLGGRTWAGALILGFVILAGTAAVVVIGLKKVTGSGRKKLVEKYESRQRQQRARYGHDVQSLAVSEQIRAGDRAAAKGSSRRSA